MPLFAPAPTALPFVEPISFLADAGSTGIWPLANRGCFLLFTVQGPLTISAVHWNQTIQGNSVDVGVYAVDPATMTLTWIASNGGTDNSLGGTGNKSLAFSGGATATLVPSTVYALGMSCNGVTMSIMRFTVTLGATAMTITNRVLQKDSVYPLPTTTITTFANPPATTFTPYLVGK